MHGLIAFCADHPHLALLIVALVAFAESLAIIGTLVPAAVVMFAAGALVGQGVLDAGVTLGLATAGAALGDSMSYELGRRQQQRLRATAFFQRRAGTLARGERFIQEHGTKSVVFARFAGAVRAVVPLLAGFAQMPRTRFYGASIGSALLWAPVHILPGVLFGTSLHLAEAVSGRLALLILVVVALGWTAVWLASRTVRWLVPASGRARIALLKQARLRRSWLARSTRAVLEPDGSRARGVALGAALLLAAGWMFLGVLEDVVSRDPLVQVDLGVFRFLQGLRTASIDQLMIAITEMGSVGVLLPLVATVALWLAWHRNWRALSYWLAAAGVGELLVELLKITLGRRRPLALYTGVEQFSFPSGHVTASTVVLGFLAFLMARGQSARLKSAVAIGAGLYIALVSFSRLYLGAHWLSDVLGGVSLGLAWVVFLAMLFSRRGDAAFARRGLLPTVILALIVSGSAWMSWQGAADLEFYAARPRPEVLSRDAWLARDWQELPALRHEIAGDAEEPFRLQWACGAETLQVELNRAGWAPAPDWSLGHVLGALAPSPPIAGLPVLPRFDRGLSSRLAFVRDAPDRPQDRLVVRLWRSDFELAQFAGGPVPPVPLWYGAIYRETRPGHGLFAGDRVRVAIEPGATMMTFLPLNAQTVSRLRGPGQQVTLLLQCAAPAVPGARPPGPARPA